ncbi:MAG TPA: YrzE family protein [Vitreimonas sp.]|nr:YrzE family protein [Vitreimonas sp.]
MTTRTEPPVRTAPVVERDVTVVATDDDRSLHWGPIVAGLVTSLSVFILLSLLAIGIGFGTMTPDQGQPEAIATIVTSIIALLSFFLGGFVAAWSARAMDPGRGALYGFLVWATWLIVLLVMSGLGLGSLFGEMGGTLGNVRAPDLTPEQIFDALSTGALGSFFALALAALAAALGGIVGTNDELYGRFRRR